MISVQCDFSSQVLGMAMSMNVLLPQEMPLPGQSYAQPGDRRYPVLFLLHGITDDQTIWMRRTSIERYAEKHGLAVVMPNAHNSFYTDMKHGRRYFTYVSEEIPAIARTLFPLSREREETFVGGISMGGYGALKTALAFPDRFCAGISFSGVLDLASHVKDPADMFAAEYRLIFGGAVDISGTGDDLLHLASSCVASDKPVPRLYQCCGTEDFLYQDNIRFRDHARSLDLDLEYREEPAAHDWGYWDREAPQALEWLMKR